MVELGIEHKVAEYNTLPRFPPSPPAHPNATAISAKTINTRDRKPTAGRDVRIVVRPSPR